MVHSSEGSKFSIPSTSDKWLIELSQTEEEQAPEVLRL